MKKRLFKESSLSIYVIWALRMWCCYQIMSRQTVDLMSKRCCIWCQCHQMHWRLNVMSNMLHSAVKRSNARWQLSVDEVVRAASDADVIRCTDDCFVSKTLLHSISSRSDDRQLMSKLLHSIAMKLNALTMLFDVRKAASDFEQSNALTKLFVIKTAAFDAEIIECIDEIVWLSACCIWSWNDQMHADGCLLRKFIAVEMQRHSRWSWRSESSLLMQRHSLWCRGVALDVNVIECSDDCWCQMIAFD